MRALPIITVARTAAGGWLVLVVLTKMAAAQFVEPPMRTSWREDEIVQVTYITSTYQGIVLARRGRECYVQFIGRNCPAGGEYPMWLPQECIAARQKAVPHLVEKRPGPPDLAPLYQALGAATCGVGLVVLTVFGLIFAVRRAFPPPLEHNHRAPPDLPAG